MASNRRDYPRHTKRLRARYRDAHDTWKSCFTGDVSVSGVFFESVFIPRTDPVEVEIHLAEGQAVKVRGKVVRAMRVPAQLLRVARGGFAVKLMEAPPDWYEYCFGLGKQVRGAPGES